MLSSPETPTLRKKSSNKRIVISSSSQELIRFLTLPNTSVNQDPRDRIRIVTPKSKVRSVSNSVERNSKEPTLKKKPSALSRVTFIRKKASLPVWDKKSSDIRSGKLSLSDNYKRQYESVKDVNDSMTISSSCRLDFTFGLNQSSHWLRA